MHSQTFTRFGMIALGVTASALTLAACSGGSETKQDSTTTTTTTTTTPAANETVAAPAAAAAPAADNVDTITGVKFADFTGDAAAGATVFIQCKTCHEVAAGVNKIGPSLNGIIGRPAGTIAGFNYTPANKNSGITWTPEKMFQYLEKPARIVPGTKMAFAGIPDPQKRADVIAYLAAQK